MARPKKARPTPPDAGDARGMTAMSACYLEWMRVRNYATATVTVHERGLRHFAAACAERGVLRPEAVTRPLIERYQRHLHHYRKADGRPLSISRQTTMLSVVRGFFRYLVRHCGFVHNPASELELPRQEQRLPQAVLTPAEVETVMSEVDLRAPLGFRDRAILETFYSTGIRRGELIRLAVRDLDRPRGALLIRQGKGKKDRLVPVGERAVYWLEKYLEEQRPALVVGPDEGTLFLTKDGAPISLMRLGRLVRRYVEAAGIAKPGACHLFRHSCATAMLEGGADIRYIQELLGHVKLETTQIYTRVSIRKLKEVHTRTHPAARLRARLADDESEDEAVEASADESHP